MLIGPQRSKASDLDKQIADTNAAIDSARALTLQESRERRSGLPTSSA